MRNMLIAVMATTALTVCGTAVVAQAADAAPTDETTVQLGEWDWVRFTDWQTDPTSPADPDGESGEDNVANVVQIGEGYSVAHSDAYRQKINDGWQRFTAWQTSDVAPAVGPNEEAGYRYSQTITDQTGSTETIPGTPGFWQNFEPTDKHAPLEGAPSWPTDPRGKW